MKFHIKKGSNVEVISGSEKGKKGVVLEVKKETLRVRIDGVKMMTKHTKEEGLKQIPGQIHYSNLKLVDAPTKKKAATKKASKNA